MTTPSMDDVYKAINEAKAQGAHTRAMINTMSDQMAAAAEEFKKIFARRPSADESVVAGVDVNHRLIDLWIKPGACASHTPESLAEQVMSAITEASAETDKRRGAIRLPTTDLGS